MWEVPEIHSYTVQRVLRAASLGLGAVVVMAGTWAIVAPARPSTAVVGYQLDTRAGGTARFRPLAPIDPFTSVTLVIDGMSVATDARPDETVGTLLRSAGLEVAAGDKLSVGLEQPLVAGLRIVLDRGMPVTVVDGGVPVALRAQPGTVASFLSQSGIALGPNDRLEVAPQGPVVAGAVIGIQRITESTAVETIPIAPSIQTIAEPGQYVGWSYIKVAGTPGQVRVTFIVRSVNGVEAERTVLSREDILAPVAQVVQVGVKPKPAPPASAEIEAIIRSAAAKYGADPEQLLRVAYCESRYDPLAYNGILGASGLFQIIPGTWRANSARAGLGGASVWDPVANASVAAWMFAHWQAGQWACK